MSGRNARAVSEFGMPLIEQASAPRYRPHGGAGPGKLALEGVGCVSRYRGGYPAGTPAPGPHRKPQPRTPPSHRWTFWPRRG